MCRCIGEEGICAGCQKYKAIVEPKFKVGDKVYSLAHGVGEVTRINHPSGREDHVQVYCLITQKAQYFTKDGVEGYSWGPVSLFHDKPTIIPAKRKVKKWKWVYENPKEKGTTLFTEFQSEKNDSDGCIKLPWTEIEVEE